MISPTEKQLVQIDLESWLPKENEIIRFDISVYLEQGLVLREAKFRDDMEALDWAIYAHKFVLIECTSQAIIPPWAYLIISFYVHGAGGQAFHSPSDYKSIILYYKILSFDLAPYQDKRILIKGCSQQKIGIETYIALAQRLQPVAKSIAWGESCSMVPLYKQ